MKIPLACLVLLSLEYANAQLPTKIESISKQYLGGAYVWGGNSPETGMDCSGYVKYVFDKVGIKLPRTAYSQSKIGEKIDPHNLKKGDLLFFLTDKKRKIPITHVGIYLGNNKFIHAASSKKGIIISPLKGSYYGKRLKLARRIIEGDKGLNESLTITLNEEALKSSMDVKITSFGGLHDTF